MCFNNFIIQLNGIHYFHWLLTWKNHVCFLFPSQPSVDKQFCNVFSMGETQMLLLHKIKYLYKFSMQTQRNCIAFISFHSSQLLIHPGNELLNLQQAQFLLIWFYKESWVCHLLYRWCRREHVTCFNISCTPKGRANGSGQTWIIRLVFILNRWQSRNTAIEN